jgi:hypothetical protein
MKIPISIKRKETLSLANIVAGDSRHRWRSVLVVGELLLVAALAFWASQRQLTLVLFLPLGVGLVLTFLRWPSLGIIVAWSSGLFVPFLGPSGLNVTMILLALLLGLWLLDMIVYQRLQLAPSRTVRPLLSFLVVAALSFGIGQLPWLTFALHAPLGAQLGGLSIVVLSAGTFLLVANQMREVRWLKTMTWVLLALGGVFFLGLFIPGLKLIPQRLFQSPDPAFFIWFVCLAFGQVAFNGEIHPRWRLALGGLLLLCLYYLVFLRFDNKSGWIPSLVGIAAIITFRFWRAGFVIILVLILSSLFLAPMVMSSDEYSVSTRFDALLIMAQIIKISPIWGLGFANYYWYTPLFPIRGYAVSFNSHNNYVDIVAQTGLIGLICFLWFFWEIGRVGWRLREQVPAGFARAYTYGALGGLIAMLTAAAMADWVLPFFYNVGLQGFRTAVLTWLFLGGLVSLEPLARREQT